MNKKEQEFYEYLVNLLTEKGVWLTEKEQKELTTKLDALTPDRVTKKTKKVNMDKPLEHQ